MKDLHAIFALIISSISFAQSPQNLAIPGVTSTGAGTSNVIKFPGAVHAPNLGGTFYASQYPGQSNNGITSTFGDDLRCGAFGSGGVGGCTVVADPAYPITEQPYSIYNKWTFPSPSNALYHDQRKGWDLRISHNPPKNSYSLHQSSFSDACIFTSLLGWSNGKGWQSQQEHCHDFSVRFANPGINLGNTNPETGGWSVQAGLALDMVVNTPGITEAVSVSDIKAGIGDHTNYIYHWNYGGAVAGSDEGSHQLSLGGGEAQDVYLGKIATGGAGATSIKITCTRDCQAPGDGRYDIDLSRGVSGGNVTAHTSPSGQTPGTFTTDISVTPSTAWGTLAATIPTPVGSPIGKGTTLMTFIVNAGPGSTGEFTPGDLVCFTGSWHEQAKITSVSGKGPWNITAPLRHVHESGSWIMANGQCGTFIDFTANDATTAQGIPVTFHYPVDIVGSTGAHTLVYRYFRSYGGTSMTLLPGNVFWPHSASGTWSNIGGTVTVPTYRDVNGALPYINQPIISISGASDPTFNGLCTSTHSNGLPDNQIQCTQAASTGHSFGGTATISVGSTGYGNTGFTLYPGAELVDMLDYDAAKCTAAGLTAPCNDGTHTLEANNVAWMAGDTVENSHHYAAVQGTERTWMVNYNPMANSNGRSVMLYNTASAWPTNVTGNFAGDSLANSTPNSFYAYHGGTRLPPGGYTLGGHGANTGLFNYGLFMQEAPDPIGSAAIIIGCPASGCNDPNYWYYVFTTYAVAGGFGNGLKFTPSTNLFSWTAKQDSPGLINPTVTSRANGTAASMEFDSYDSGALRHRWTITAPLTGGGYILTLPQKAGTLVTTGDLVAMVASGESHAGGLVPDPGPSAGTAKFLREDATWNAPPGPVKISNSITPAAAKACQCVEQTFTYTGLTTGQGVWVSPPASLGAHIWIGSTRVAATNKLAIAFCADATAGTPPAGTYIAVAF